MAETYFPFDTGAGASVTEAQWYAMARRWLKTGTFFGELTPSTPQTGMTVQIGTGEAWIEGHFYKNDAIATVNINPASAQYRWDSIFVKLDRTAKTIAIGYRAGTPNVGNPPALTQTANVWEMPLCAVYVDVGAVIIHTDDVIDMRVYAQPFGAVPVGTVKSWAASSAGSLPAGWKIANGQAVHRWTYPDLYALISSTFGESGLQFNLPDLRGRAIVGSGQGSGLTNRAHATTFGEESHILTIAELAAHSHGGATGSHTHAPQPGAAGLALTYTGGQTTGLSSASISIQASGPGTLQNATSSIAADGGGSGHNVMQPSLALTPIIKVI